MCGISGVWNWASQTPVDRALLSRITGTLAHRGPDDSGEYYDDRNGLALGFRRLAIIDLTPAGHQPMTNEDQTLWLVFNGEIYNYRALRDQLQAKGHVFQSHTDSEVILHGYEEWKMELVHHLEGMFAFALWDAARQTLFLVRDRFGIKPLHYALTGQGIVFGSEIKALLAHPGVRRDLDLQALWNYLTFAQVPAPDSIYTAVRKLPPGKYLAARGGTVNVVRYYTLPDRAPPRGSDRELADTIQSLLRESVRTHLVADVPVGCFLSGGLDSGLVAALAAQQRPDRLKTFSVRFPDSPAHDESPYQKAMVERIQSDHYEIDAQVDLVRDLPALLRATDEPFAISSFLPLYHVARLARREVKVILSGDGSDELFGGYGRRYTRDTRRSWAGYLGRALPRSRDPEAIWHNRRWTRRLAGKAAGLSMVESERYITSYNWFSRAEKEALLQPEVLDAVPRNFGPRLEQAYDARIRPPLKRKWYYELQTTLSDEMLTKVDRATSAVSLEGRVPFLDRALAEFAWSLPPDRHWRRGVGKQLVKLAARGLIPDEIIDRPKAGFVVPLSQWIRQDRSFIRPVLLDNHDDFNRYIRPEAVTAMLHAHDLQTGDHGEKLWVLYVFKCWLAQST